LYKFAARYSLVFWFFAERGVEVVKGKGILNLAMMLVGLSMLSCVVSADTSKTIHSTDAVYPAVGPYSQIVQVGDLYFLSGVIPLNTQGNAVQGDDIETQTRQVLNYISAKLDSQEMTLSNVVMSTVYMTNLTDFETMNRVYAEYFSENPPARATVEVSRLPRGVMIEIAVIASKN
jgi:reactive intermediate/imine deaminase